MLLYGSQILRAVGQKVAFSPDIDLAEVAAATEGYSGADLQALVYNAHLEVIHSSITSKESNGAPGIVSTSSNTEAPPVEYKSFGGKEGSTTVTRTKAEEMALQKRVSILFKIPFIDPFLSSLHPRTIHGICRFPFAP